MSSIGCPGNSSAKACSRAASSSGKRTAYSFAVCAGAGVFLPSIEQGLEFHDYSAIPDDCDRHYRPRGPPISAQSKLRPINLPSSGASPHLGGAADRRAAPRRGWRRNLSGVFEYSSRALGAGLEHQQGAEHHACRAHVDCRRVAGGRRLCRRADRRCGHTRRRICIGAPARLISTDVVRFVALEALLVAATAMAQRGISLAQSLLRAQLGQRVNVMILEKALTLDLTQFEDSEFYDKLTRARREASSRPLSLVMRTFGLVQNAVSLISFGGLLVPLLALGGACCWSWPDCPRSWPKRNSRAKRFGCSAGARPNRACKSTWNRCWRARTTRRKSSCSIWDRAFWIATATFSRACTAKTAI